MHERRAKPTKPTTAAIPSQGNPQSNSERIPSTRGEGIKTPKREPEVVQTPKEDTPPPRLMTGQTYFQDMLNFMQSQCVDKRLTPAAQLLLHTLCTLANRNYWTYPFEASRDELKRITHITSDETINRAKRQLKNLGYIYFEGKPSRFTIYRPIDKRPAKGSAESAPPTPPNNQTNKQANQTIKKKTSKEEREVKSDENVHNSNANQRSNRTYDRADLEAVKAEIRRRLDDLDKRIESD